MIKENGALLKRTEKNGKILKIVGVFNCIEEKKTILFSVNLTAVVISECNFQKNKYGKDL